MDKPEQILVKYWGFSSFRPLQEEIIQAVLKRNDSLALLPTGGGKSLTFQIPALMMEGICLVITPLIALMKDQVESLKNKGIKATAIFSGMYKDEIDIVLENCIYGDYKFLYVSPERLETEMFKARVEKMKINLIAVDEAHCISQWGYDFRPSYLKIANIRTTHPGTPVLALTATATSKVIDDIQEKLQFKKKNIFQASFERKNLAYIVYETEDKYKYLTRVARKNAGTGLVYVRSRKKTKEIASYLQQAGFKAAPYHAGMSTELRNYQQDEWKKDRVKIIVATNAFGMGIDKPDVRFVVHMDLPDDLESYFQEAGRAGRDGKKSWAVILYQQSDISSLEKRVNLKYPGIKEIKNVYQALGNYFQIPVGTGKDMVLDFYAGKFVSKYHFNILLAYHSMKFLEKEGYIALSEDVHIPSKLHFIVGRDDLYKFQVKNEKLDGFIKLVLRSYSGLFSDYVNIDEQTLANRSGLSNENIYTYLKTLTKAGIVKYIPRRKNPVITYTEERLDEKNLRISKENYLNRKNRYMSRLESVKEYVTRDNECRSTLLLRYFGETNVKRCGICDFCVRRNELDLSNYELEELSRKVKKTLEDKPYFIDELVETTEGFTEEKILKVIQWLLDNNILKYNNIKQLLLNKE